MAEDDIYGNKARYESMIKNLDKIIEKPKEDYKRKYYCKNSDNLKYFDLLPTPRGLASLAHSTSFRGGDSLRFLA